MTTKTRLIILVICASLFFTITPYIILYSVGYRIDFTQMKIVTTGGIYVRAFPSGAEVVIDSKISSKTGIFSNSVFVQNLLPKQHNVLITKEGYHDYRKNLSVKDNEVTKLENVTLFKKDIIFEILPDNTQFTLLGKSSPERFIIKNNNLHYSGVEENSQLTARQKKEPVLKNLVSYQISNNNAIIWLGLDGFLKSSDLQGQNTNQLSQSAVKIIPKKYYQIKLLGPKIFLLEEDNLLLFDEQEKSFEDFYSKVKEIKISPDGQKIFYFNDNEIFIYYLNGNIAINGKGQNKILLKKSTEKIADCHWLNSDYLIFTEGEKIIISEIDARNGVNSITLPRDITLTSGKNITIEKPKIFLNQADKKLYILTPNNLLVSEKLTP